MEPGLQQAHAPRQLLGVLKGFDWSKRFVGERQDPEAIGCVVS